ncbi:hypothetical protein AQUCO_00100569v1 [Aquilegia coerulea]|uniref:Uncharacterized protein n=1 Tax=Aquilegia coerulea TaxID=218851 RepID=A0A2G5FB26_AQUCA|nr:hypothetical protein AQUCO_00100569v1 [Aquilegia coerulea]
MEEEEQIWNSDSNSKFSSNIGRVMNTLLSSRSKKLENAISRIGSGSQTSFGLLEESLCFFRNYVSDAVEKQETLDHILVPMIESSLKSKDSKHCNQVLILLSWLFKDERLFHALGVNLANVVMRKDDNYITLGWCTLIRGLLDSETTMNLSSNSEIQEKLRALLPILFSSISHLSSILCRGSIVQSGYELPTRLAVAAADCILVLTEASTRSTNTSEPSNVKTKSSETDTDTAKQPVALPFTACAKEKIKSTSAFVQKYKNMEVEVLLWDHLDELIILVERLMVWNRKSRPLHANALEKVLKWLQEIKGHCGSTSGKAGVLKTGVSLLSSCWKHYSLLLHLEDHRFSQHYLEMLNQYISGIQFYMNDHSKEHFGNKDSGIETRKFFLISISLLLGRLDKKQFETAMAEYGLQISRLLLSQCTLEGESKTRRLLYCVDEDVVEVAVSILRATIFKTNCSLTARSLMDTEQMETVFPLLLSLLDERDNWARAVVVLIAECCSINADGQCLQEVFRRLNAKKILQRRNAIDVISELMHISSESKNSLSLSMQQDIAKNLLDRFVDDEPDIRVQASKVVATCDPLLILCELVSLVYDPYERVRKSASDTLVEVLKCHNQNPEVIVMLIDNLSKLCQSSQHANSGRGEVEGSKFDSDQLLKLIPHWSKSVQDWSVFIEPLLNKMFAEPSNAVIVRFLSYISEDLAEAPDLVLRCVLLYMQGQNEIKDTQLFNAVSNTCNCDESIELKNSLFGRLCPLLVIRMLPLKVFNDLSSTVMYGQLLNVDALHVSAKELKEDFNEHRSCSIAAMLVTRAFHKFEYEDVRKLAAELCGRIHPQVLYPIIRSLLGAATSSRDILQMKACLFALCTSLVLRGSDSAHHPVIFEIRKILDKILLWPSVNGDEVSKAQHGCIDCLALMVCAELQTPDSFEECSKRKTSISKDQNSYGEATSKNSVLSYVIHNLTNVRKESTLSDELDGQSYFNNNFSDAGLESRAVFSFSFHLCMANVLISACQKISSSGKYPLAERILPFLIHSAEVMQDSEVRAACIQVLFSAVYHLKSAVLPYSCDLLKLSVKALKKGSPEEKMASVKLMASLLASEDVVVTSISGGLLEARSALSNISLMDPSMELRQLCKELLICITSPI